MIWLLLLSCKDEPGPSASPEVYPRLLAGPDDLQAVLDRLDSEPWATVYALLLEQAEREPELPDTETWDHDAIGTNNQIAQDAAMVAWLQGDEAMADKARDILLSMPTDFETNQTWDVDIRMPHPLMGGVFAHELLLAGGFLSQDESEEIEERLTTVCGAFYNRYVLDVGYRQLALGFAQNNHPIRTAAAIGTVALAYPDHPQAEAWANWAFSELDYLWGPTGHYVQPDGGVSEGPHYYGFALAPSLAFFIAADNVAATGPFERNCINRQGVDPWQDHGCVDGESFEFENPLFDPTFRATVDWSINLRLPAGWRAPLADAYFRPLNGGGLLTSYGGEPYTAWDWLNSGDDEPPATSGYDLLPHHLVYLAEAEGGEPEWTNRTLIDAGNAVFRSDWGTDAVWGMVVAESGSARKTLHDHVDGLSFSLAAYGEYLLVDPGYYKPNELDNAVTADADSHNVILIDGQGAPDKGLLNDWGDADAFLENPLDGERLASVEARQSYQDTEIRRSVVFVDQSWFVVADRLDTDRRDEREHTWRVGGWAGYDAGGSFELSGDTARFERELAGVSVHLQSTDGLLWTEPAYEALHAPHVEEMDRDRNQRDHGVADGLATGVAPDFLAVLMPYRTGQDQLAVVAVEGAVAWLVDERWLVWLNQGEDELLGVTTDAELAVVALDGSAAYMARGSYVAVDGAAVLDEDATGGVAATE